MRGATDADRGFIAFQIGRLMIAGAADGNPLNARPSRNVSIARSADVCGKLAGFQSADLNAAGTADVQRQGFGFEWARLSFERSRQVKGVEMF